MKTQSIVLVLAGIVVGCGAGATVAVSWAGPTPGKWQCYKVDDLPDVAEAANEKYAQRFSNSMNQIAPSAPAGSVVQMAITSGRHYNYLCAMN